MNRGKILMIERCEHFGFALEPRNSFGILGEFYRRNVNRHVASQILILRLIGLTHTAFSTDSPCSPLFT